MMNTIPAPLRLLLLQQESKNLEKHEMNVTDPKKSNLSGAGEMKSMNNIGRVPKPLQKEYGSLTMEAKVKLPEPKKYISHSKLNMIAEDIAADKSNSNSGYFPKYLASNGFIRDCLDQIVDTETGNVVKESEMKKDGKYLKIWWAGFALPGNDYQKIIDTGNASTSMIFILVPVKTTDAEIVKGLWEGWEFYVRLNGGVFKKISDENLLKFKYKSMPRIDGITRNLMELGGRHIPILPPQIYKSRIKSFLKRNTGEKKNPKIEEPNLGEEESTSEIMTSLDEMPDYEEGVQDLDEEEYNESDIAKAMGEEEGEENEEEEEGKKDEEKDEEEGEEDEEGEEVEPVPPVKVTNVPSKKVANTPPPPTKKAPVAAPPQKKAGQTPAKNTAPPKQTPVHQEKKMEPPAKPKVTPPAKEQTPVKSKTAPTKKVTPPENPTKTNGTTPKKSLKPDVPPSIAKNHTPDVAPKRKLTDAEEVELNEPTKKKKKGSTTTKDSTESEANGPEETTFDNPTSKKIFIREKLQAATTALYTKHSEEGDDFLKLIDPFTNKSFEEIADWFADMTTLFLIYEDSNTIKKSVANKDLFGSVTSEKGFTAKCQTHVEEYAKFRYMLLHKLLRCAYYKPNEQ